VIRFGMGLFGNKDEDKAAAAEALQGDVSRLEGLSLSSLAAEVMSKGFGPGAPGADEAEAVTIGGPNIGAGVSLGQIASQISAAREGNGVDEATVLRLDKLVAEGIQQLEHASLIRTQIHTASNSFDYALTRRGREALSQGSVDRFLSGP
jgi:hypothetical protein